MEYKALTTVNLPFTEVVKKPGDLITEAELAEAQQSDEAIKQLVDSGAIGGKDDPLDPSTIIPDPGMPTIESVVAEAQAAVADLESKGEDVPAELKAVADLDYTHVATGDAGSGGDASA